MPYVYGYVRVSDPHQLESEVTSLDTQTSLVETKFSRVTAEVEGLVPADILAEEAVSAFNKPFCERPKGRVLNERLRRGDHVVFPRLDRAFRRIRDCVNTVEMWWDRGVIVHILDLPYDTSTVMGRGMLHFAALMAEMESGQKSERQKARYAYSVLNNLTVGNRAPFGKRWLVDKRGKRKLVDDPIDRAVYLFVFKTRLQEGRGRDALTTMVQRLVSNWLTKHHPDMSKVDRYKTLARFGLQRVRVMASAADTLNQLRKQGTDSEFLRNTFRAIPDPDAGSRLRHAKERAREQQPAGDVPVRRNGENQRSHALRQQRLSDDGSSRGGKRLRRNLRSRH